MFESSATIETLGSGVLFKATDYAGTNEEPFDDVAYDMTFSGTTALNFNPVDNSAYYYKIVITATDRSANTSTVEKIVFATTDTELSTAQDTGWAVKVGDNAILPAYVQTDTSLDMYKAAMIKAINGGITVENMGTGTGNQFLIGNTAH